MSADNAAAPPLLCLHGVTRGWQSFLPLLPTLADGVAGIVAGALVLAAVSLFQRLRGRAA